MVVHIDYLQSTEQHGGAQRLAYHVLSNMVVHRDQLTKVLSSMVVQID
jgi:hypothetical protein